MKQNCLIEGFRKQTKTTILKHLDALAENFVVYSNRLKGVSTLLKNHELYIYIYERCMVVVCLDNSTPQDELADEEPFSGRRPQYFTEMSHRTSPVWRLSQTISKLLDRLMDIDLKWDEIGRASCRERV